MEVGESFNLIPNILNIRYIENPGASFGMLADHRWVFMSLTSVALVLMFGAMIYLGMKKSGKLNRWLNISVALVFGGGVGNMIDRMFNISADPRREGINVVVDFFEFDFVNFAIFNFADVFITIGAASGIICYICKEIRVYRAEKQKIYYAELRAKKESEHEDILKEAAAALVCAVITLLEKEKEEKDGVTEYGGRAED